MSTTVSHARRPKTGEKQPLQSSSYASLSSAPIIYGNLQTNVEKRQQRRNSSRPQSQHFLERNFPGTVSFDDAKNPLSAEKKNSWTNLSSPTGASASPQQRVQHNPNSFLYKKYPPGNRTSTPGYITKPKSADNLSQIDGAANDFLQEHQELGRRQRLETEKQIQLPSTLLSRFRHRTFKDTLGKTHNCAGSTRSLQADCAQSEQSTGCSSQTPPRLCSIESSAFCATNERSPLVRGNSIKAPFGNYRQKPPEDLKNDNGREEDQHHWDQDQSAVATTAVPDKYNQSFLAAERSTAAVAPASGGRYYYRERGQSRGGSKPPTSSSESVHRYQERRDFASSEFESESSDGSQSESESEELALLSSAASDNFPISSDTRRGRGHSRNFSPTAHICATYANEEQIQIPNDPSRSYLAGELELRLTAGSIPVESATINDNNNNNSQSQLSDNIVNSGRSETVDADPVVTSRLAIEYFRCDSNLLRKRKRWSNNTADVLPEGSGVSDIDPSDSDSESDRQPKLDQNSNGFCCGPTDGRYLVDNRKCLQPATRL
ncbi:unnamed protein product [Hermetia illucens]|uniref:Uncharacterized protein n=1 Tax=Hermetia illucens TaxID=343691 RepID=A0A7R8YSX6_HERIL|nr:unnamed protein product [Hermetia illucens]